MDRAFTTRDGVELAYRIAAVTAIPLVMLHGWGQTQAMFRHQRRRPGPRPPGRDRRPARARPSRPSRTTATGSPGWSATLTSCSTTSGSSASTCWMVDGRVGWWSFIDQYGTDRIRRFVAVDQPAAWPRCRG